MMLPPVCLSFFFFFFFFFFFCGCFQSLQKFLCQGIDPAPEQGQYQILNLPRCQGTLFFFFFFAKEYFAYNWYNVLN